MRMNAVGGIINDGGNCSIKAKERVLEWTRPQVHLRVTKHCGMNGTDQLTQQIKNGKRIEWIVNIYLYKRNFQKWPTVNAVS